MDSPDHVVVPYIVEVIAFLLSVVIIVPAFKRINVSPILGYLAVGMAIGPHALSIVDDVEEVQHFAELGVIFLLFAIGLELSFDRLKAYSRLIFGLGLAQVIFCALAIGGVAFFWGNSPQASAIIGLSLALSSTAMVVNLLNESGEFSSKYGRASFSILLFQDLAVVPILILVSALGGSGEASLLVSIILSVLRALIAVVLIIILGRYVLRYLFRMASKTRSVDVFTATSLLVVLATSLATGLAGLSMALGAFLAGLLLAETEFKHQIEAEMEPFKGLFLGLFFMGVGMNLDLETAFHNGAWVILSVIGVILIKAVITAVFALFFRMHLSSALRIGLLLSESGEFAFVVIGQATVTYHIIDMEVGQFMVVVATLSMMLTPLLAGLGRRLSDRFEPKGDAQELQENSVEHVSNHVIIGGFGRAGRSVSQVLEKHSIDYVAIDRDAEKISKYHKQNLPVFVGDVSRHELLKLAGVERASTLLLTMDDAGAVIHALLSARQNWPELAIIVRAYDNSHSEELIAAGATTVVVETLEAGLQLSGHVLCSVGMPREEVNACIELVRRENRL